MKESARQVRARRKRNGSAALTVVHQPNNPIIVNPKKHRGKDMAPPAPRIEVKPEPFVVPAGMKVECVKLEISRWSHEGPDLWTPKF